MSRQRRSSSEVWEQDRDTCGKCSIEFGFFTRRHHCRQCGLCVCDACSNHRFLVPSLGTVERVCKDCHYVLSSTLPGEDAAGGEATVVATSAGADSAVSTRSTGTDMVSSQATSRATSASSSRRTSTSSTASSTQHSTSTGTSMGSPHVSFAPQVDVDALKKKKRRERKKKKKGAVNHASGAITQYVGLFSPHQLREISPRGPRNFGTQTPRARVQHQGTQTAEVDEFYASLEMYMDKIKAQYLYRMGESEGAAAASAEEEGQQQQQQQQQRVEGEVNVDDMLTTGVDGGINAIATMSRLDLELALRQRDVTVEILRTELNAVRMELRGKEQALLAEQAARDEAKQSLKARYSDYLGQVITDLRDKFGENQALVMALREDTRRVREYLRSNDLTVNNNTAAASVPSSLDKDASLKPALQLAKQEYRARGRNRNRNNVPNMRKKNEDEDEGENEGNGNTHTTATVVQAGQGKLIEVYERDSPAAHKHKHKRVEGFLSPTPSDCSNGAPSARSTPDISVGPEDASGLDMSGDSGIFSHNKLGSHVQRMGEAHQRSIATSTTNENIHPNHPPMIDNGAGDDDVVKRSIWG